MPQRATLVRIPQPCPESWDAMAPAATGRHCAACQKTVVDFTKKTDAEILMALHHAAGQTCGRLRPDQLERPLVPAAAPGRWRSWLGAVLALGGMLGAGRAAAQTRSYYAGPFPAVVSTSTSTQHGQPAASTSAPPASTSGSGPVTLRGVVTDVTTHQGIPGVTVLVKGTTLGVSTDVNGAFTLSVEASATPAQLLISSVGYVTQEHTAAPNQLLTVALSVDSTQLSGEVVIIGGISQRPWPWHPRRFFNWSKYWLTKPFRAG
ncbi:hypothetical protein GCM10023172_27200 [Hymenobacter ginsengisoli]|uniref:TonB-dependent receptor plug domain-containing protein n=1 Tax=Hymenobacter ginsengisoli TaxID=1051626 RepID=A0ABP8QH35_9BACT|nr:MULTISPECIES: carboxypeptidase-like regulatory domain-containing protein [unclassified Hymenobacter]MBO2030025.1 carboxypeptidase-like regulatory domain-containing protein [Hymenobacter sp. BT559]